MVAFALLNAIHAGAWLTLGPAMAKETFGERGWGYALSAESVGLLLTTAVMMRRRLERPLLVGMIAISALSLPLILLGSTSSVLFVVIGALIAGAGIEVFNLGWNLAMQENIEERMLSRAYSYDALGSLIAMPVGQLAYGALGRGVRLPRGPGRQRDRVRRHRAAHARLAVRAGAAPGAGAGRVVAPTRRLFTLSSTDPS